MANRRMFSLDIVASDAFLEMPTSTRELYFHLGMYADDEGFVNPKKIMRMIGASEDDLKVLLGKRFLLVFESGVVVVKHWKMNNYLQNDRLKPTVYLEEKNLLTLKKNGSYTECIHSIVESSIVESSIVDYGVKTPDKELTQLKDNDMRTIALDEFGEEMETPPAATPKKYAGKNKLYSRIAVYYMQLLNKTGNALQFFPAIKEIFKLCEADFPTNSEEDSEKEIKAHILAANTHYQKLNYTDWGLKKVAENWNKISQEWR